MREDFDFEALKVNGIKVNYFCICPRKLWLFSHHIRLEPESEKVLLGKLLHEESYSYLERKEVLLEGLLKIDVVEGGKVLEVKYSRKMKEAARSQLLYYLYYLKQRGIIMKGELRFPKERKREEVELDESGERKVEEILRGIKEVECLPAPPSAEYSSICRRCAYMDLCWG